MIIYLYGNDSYRRQAKLREIVGEYKKKHSGLTFDRFYLDEGDVSVGGSEWRKFKDFASAQSLFGENKLAVISGLSSLSLVKKDIELIKFLADFKKITLILSEEKKLGAAFSFLLKKPVISQEFNDLNSKQFGIFIAQEAGKRKIKLTIEQLRELVGEYNGDTWGVVNELDKISLIKNPQLPIASNQVNSQPSIPSLFNLINKLRSGDLTTRLPALELLLSNEDSAKIFNLTAYSAGAEQKKIFADYDAAIKSGKLDYEVALTELII